MSFANPLGRIGFFLGPLAGLLCYFLLPDADAGGINHAGRAAVALGVWMAIWWMTEAIPLAATALMPREDMHE